MSQSPTLLVLAAGMGSRYGGLKQIDPIGPSGEVVLDYSVYDAVRAGFERVVFIIRRDIEEDFRGRLEADFAGRIAVDYVFQELDKLPEGYAVPEGRAKPWGTAHAMLMGREAINGPFGIINADDYYGPEAFGLMHDKLRELGGGRGHYTMVGYELRKTLSENGGVSRGVCEVEDGWLGEVLECHEIKEGGDGVVTCEFQGAPKTLAGDELVSMNFWGFTADAFDHARRRLVDFLDAQGDSMKGEYLIPELMDNLIKSGEAKCEVMSTAGSWFGVTYPADKPVVQQAVRDLVEQGVYPESLWS